MGGGGQTPLLINTESFSVAIMYKIIIVSFSIGRSLPHITDVSWRLEYQIKTSQLHKMYRPAYLVTLNVENTDFPSHPEINFSCNMEQLQDLVGKLKDASKSLERATQL